MQVIETGFEAMSGSELLDTADDLARWQRETEAATLRVAVQWAVLNNEDTVDPERVRLPGRERARVLGGSGTPAVAEFAAAELGARLGLSPWGGAALMADALDIEHRLPRIRARVQAGEVKVSYARFVARKTRHLAVAEAAMVDARVAQAADGRVSWSRFETLVEAAIKAADPQAAAARERAAATAQFAKATGSTEDGIRGFYIRAGFEVIARLEATIAYLAQALAAMGDPRNLDERRVAAVLIISHPVQAARFLAAYQAWKDRPTDPAHMPADQDDQDEPVAAEPERTGPRPVIAWDKLLPTVVIYAHYYADYCAGRAGQGTGIVRVEDHGPITEHWVRQRLGQTARFKIHPVIDLAGQAPVDAYEVPERHRQAVHLITPADTFPYASNLSRHKQLDHTQPYDHAAPPGAGQSRIGNYGPLTGLHHRIKTHGRWQVTQPYPGIYLWRDTHGATYLVDHTGTRRVGRSPITTARRSTPIRVELVEYDPAA